MSQRTRRPVLALSLVALLGAFLSFCSLPRLTAAFFVAEANRSIRFIEGVNQAASPVATPYGGFTPSYSISGASKGAYVDTSLYVETAPGCSFSYGADGSGAFLRHSSAANLPSWGLLALNIHQPLSVFLRYTVNDNPTSLWRFSFFSEKNGGGSVVSTSFAATSWTEKSLRIDVSTLNLPFVSESLSLYWILDSGYALQMSVAEISVEYRC